MLTINSEKRFEIFIIDKLWLVLKNSDGDIGN